MRASEFIIEDATGSLAPGVANALPATWVLPDLKSQDPYLQYRFGLALAAARAQKAGEVTYSDESMFGEKMVVMAYSKEEEQTLNLALTLFGKDNASQLISTRSSKESSDVSTKSPVANINPKRKITY